MRRETSALPVGKESLLHGAAALRRVSHVFSAVYSFRVHRFLMSIRRRPTGRYAVSVGYGRRIQECLDHYLHSRIRQLAFLRWKAAKGFEFMSATCAIITAARMGLRHNIMKPLLALNGSTVVKNAVQTLRQASCDPLIVVSGRNSNDLIRHLGRKEVVHVINSDFNKTDMFHSFILGLTEAPAEAELIYFLPADVPLMNSDSLLAMERYMVSHPECHILRPSRRGSVGHPVLLRRQAADFMLSWRGEGGLREAMAEYPGVSSLLELDDEGMQLDVDRKDDFECFLAYAEAQAQLRPVNCHADIILGRDKPFFNSLLADLLRQIDATGSLSTACAAQGISYSNGWKSIKSAEIQFGFDLLESTRGGRGGGVSRLTKQARELLARYDRLEAQINRLCSENMREYFGRIN